MKATNLRGRPSMWAALLTSVGLLAVAVPAFSLDDAAKAADPAAKQVAEGKKLYGRHCAKCHGDSGQGTKNAPPVVGASALPLDPPATAKVRKTQFHTAGDVLDFVSANMPAKKPGSLKPAEYEAILAFDLEANGVHRTGSALDASTAKTIELHK
jgi:mono/diheme cytochrome c family protein